MTFLAIIGFIVLCLITIVSIILTFQISIASMWRSELSVLAVLFCAISIGLMLLTWHFAPFSIVVKTI